MPFTPTSCLLRLAVTGSVIGAIAGCFDEPTFNDEPEPADEGIFFDGFGGGIDFQAFAGTNQANPNAQALLVDSAEAHSGRASLQVVVPGIGDPAGGFAGGAFVAGTPRDLSAFNALSFFVKGSRAATFDVVGFGNDNTGSAPHLAERKSVAFGADWTEVVIPFPDAAQLTSERGMFHFAEGADGTPPTGYTLWLDDIQFVTLTSEELGAAEPSIKADALALEVGDTATVTETRVHFAARDVAEVVDAAAGYFDYASSDAAVATVDDAGRILANAVGNATVTASLAGVAAAGALELTVTPSVRPVTIAPVPTQAPANVISLFSDAYTNVPVDSWRADWSVCGEQADEDVAGDAVKRFAAVEYVGIEFVSNQLNVTSMTTFHIDLWTPDSSEVRVKIVDFGADGVFGNDDTEHELVFTSSSNPALVLSDWTSLELPLSAFVGLRNRAHVAQLVISGTESEIYVDNIYFHR